VLPDFQGLGLGAIVLDLVGAAYTAMGKKLNIVTSHPAFVKSLNRSKNWAMIRQPSRLSQTMNYNNMSNAQSVSRLTATFRYVGQPNTQLVSLYTNDLQ
jgi:hypothetical protein